MFRLKFIFILILCLVTGAHAGSAPLARPVIQPSAYQQSAEALATDLFKNQSLETLPQRANSLADEFTTLSENLVQRLKQMQSDEDVKTVQELQIRMATILSASDVLREKSLQEWKSPENDLRIPKNRAKEGKAFFLHFIRKHPYLTLAPWVPASIAITARITDHPITQYSSAAAYLTVAALFLRQYFREGFAFDTPERKDHLRKERIGFEFQMELLRGIKESMIGDLRVYYVSAEEGQKERILSHFIHDPVSLFAEAPPKPKLQEDRRCNRILVDKIMTEVTSATKKKKRFFFF